MLIFLIVLTQGFYTIGDLWKKIVLNKEGFNLSVLLNPLFLAGLFLPAVGFLVQMYVFSRYELSRTIVTLGTFAVIFSSIAGIWYLKERFTLVNYLGLLFAVLAIILTNIRK